MPLNMNRLFSTCMCVYSSLSLQCASRAFPKGLGLFFKVLFKKNVLEHNQQGFLHWMILIKNVHFLKCYLLLQKYLLKWTFKNPYF